MQRINEPDELQLEFRDRFPELVLASSSPNRKKLLEIAGINVRIFVPGINEEKVGRTNEEKILNIAKQKIECYAESSEFNHSIPAIAADTLVLFKNDLIGKPADRNEAERILTELRGRHHEVLTAVGLYLPEKGISIFLDKSYVVFRDFSDNEIEEYLNRGEWKGAAGGYRLQATGYELVERIDGDWTNVVGLPLKRILDESLS